MTFTVDYRPTSELSLNTRLHWAAVKRLREDVMDLTYVALRNSRVPVTPILGAVDITITYPAGRMDIDNHGYIAKAIIDALRYHGILRNDSRRHVASLRQAFGAQAGIVVAIAPVAA